MSAIWNPFVASTVTLRTSLSPDGCAERLGQCVTQAMEAAPRAQKPLTGRFTSAAFTVRWRSGYAGDIRPVAKGRFDTDPAGTVIVVRIGMQLKGWFMVIAWTVFSLGFGALQVARELGNAHVPAAERAARAMEALVPGAVMLGMLAVGLLLAGWIHRGEADDIVDTLKTALDASPGPDFRPLT